jgi:hypothetical protein
MPRKKTSPAVSAIAGRVLATDLAEDTRARVEAALVVGLQAAGFPINPKATEAITARIVEALKPTIDDLRGLAGSALTQDETAGNVEADE